jgi:hypothetical protein
MTSIECVSRVVAERIEAVGKLRRASITGGRMELNPDFQEFLRSFVGHDVRFLIVGGYALAAHGQRRYTKDLDVWVWTDPSNVYRYDVES